MACHNKKYEITKDEKVEQQIIGYKKLVAIR